MKVFFTATQRGKKQYNNQYLTIYKTLEKLGCKHLDSTLIDVTTEAFYKDLEDRGRAAHVDLYNKNLNSIKHADINIFECTLHSFSVGFMVEKSLELNKPTVVLYHGDKMPFFLDGTDHEKIIFKSYEDANIEDVMKEAIEEAMQIRDKRFNFFISPHLLTYLEEAAKKEGITKSGLLRNLILLHMKKNK